MQRVILILALGLGVETMAIGQGTHPTKKPVSATGARAASVAPLKNAAKQFVTTGCDPTLWQHVYHPARLVKIEDCIAVTGTIQHAKPEADGDQHVQLHVDPQFEGLLNDVNKTAQANSLVLEPICQHAPTQTDAIPACRDFHSNVDVPKRGTKVRVTGSYVLDTEKPDHGWTEIHPVTKIEVVE